MNYRPQPRPYGIALSLMTRSKDFHKTTTTKKRTSGMKTTIKYVERWKDRHGKTRLYFRKGKGQRFTLRGPEGSPEFWEDYQAASNGEITKRPTKTRALAGTMRWLVEQYYQSPCFKELRQTTQVMRRNILERFTEKHGTKRYTYLKPRHLRKMRDEKSNTPEAANNLIKVIRQVFRFAVNYDYLEDNPARNIEKLKPKNRTGFHAWTIEEVKQFESHHKIGTKARLAFAILLYTGQRRGDVIHMGKQHTKDGWIKLTQQKTGKSLEIPILNELQRIIDASETGDLTFIASQRNRPYSAASFGNWFRNVCDEAGLPQCSAHGVRKATAARLAEIGCTTLEIMSITGHVTLSEIERYTKSAAQKQLAESVRKKIDGPKT